MTRTDCSGGAAANGAGFLAILASFALAAELYAVSYFTGMTFPGGRGLYIQAPRESAIR